MALITIPAENIVTADEKAARQRAALKLAMETAIQRHLDATAALRSYDGIQTAVTYRDDPNPQFAAEGQALFAWRSEVWTYATAELAKVQAGARAVPTVEALIGELPAMVWPAT